MSEQILESKGRTNIVTLVIGCVFCLFSLLYSVNFFSRVGIFFPGNQFNAIFLAGALTMIFLVFPASKKDTGKKPSWYDYLLILCGLAGSIYMVVNARAIMWAMSITASTEQLIIGLIFIFAVLEACRRTMGWPMVVIALVFILYVKFGYLFSGVFGLPEYSWNRVVADIYLSTQGIFGPLSDLASTVIISFIVFGEVFSAAGGGKFFMNLAMALTGKSRGGPAKAGIVGSALFGMISGSGVANVMVTGVITIPLMKRTGMSAVFAGAVESVASSGGMIVPPIMGAIAFVMAALLGVSYTTICIAAIIPAFLYYLALFCQVHLRAAKEGLRGLPPEEIPSIKETFKQGWELTLPIIVLVVLLFFLKMTVAESAIYTIVIVLLLAMFRKQNRPTLRGLVKSFDVAFRETTSIAALIALAGAVMAMLSVTGLAPRLSSGLVTISGGQGITLAIMAAIIIVILGMGVSALLTYIVLAALVPNALAQSGIPLLASHFFLVFFGVSMMFSPPYAPVAFVAAKIAKASYYRIGFQAMRLGIVAFIVPFVFLYDPVLLMQGSPMNIIISTVTAIIGVVLLSVGLEGYLFTRVTWFQRILFIGAGILTIIPEWWTDLIGIILMIILILWQIKNRGVTTKTLDTPK